MDLHSGRKFKHNSQNQFMLAAIEKPTRFHTRLQRVQYEGASARKDAEGEVRSQWLQILCGIVSNTNTPMGRMVRDKPDSIQPLGAGRRATTLRARYGSQAHSLSPFPSEVPHVVEYLQVKLIEPSNRESINGAHQAMCFFEEVCGVGESDRYTNSVIYLLAKKEVLASALPGTLPRQAPRFPTALLAAIEDLVLDETAFCYFRICGWWLLVQSWRTIRFQDHRVSKEKKQGNWCHEGTSTLC